jgi:hypothetical protein
VIVVLGSRHDKVAVALVDAWPSARLCSAEDLTRPGWACSLGTRRAQTWVVDGTVVDDDLVTGVFVRRSAVYAEELVTTHPDDRAYLAAEAQAFLVFMLAATRATVVNPVADGTLGDGVLRPDRWMRAAPDAGLVVAPLRLTHRPISRRPRKTFSVEVVGDQAFGDAPAEPLRGAVALARTLDLYYGTFVFDGRRRLITITTAPPPSVQAAAALGRLLAARAA